MLDQEYDSMERKFEKAKFELEQQQERTRVWNERENTARANKIACYFEDALVDVLLRATTSDQATFSLGVSESVLNPLDECGPLRYSKDVQDRVQEKLKSSEKEFREICSKQRFTLVGFEVSFSKRPIDIPGTGDAWEPGFTYHDMVTKILIKLSKTE